MHHLDVVPAGDGWRVAPFSGRPFEGKIWGRGALDVKGLGIAQLAALVALKREGLALERDLIYLAVADRERNMVSLIQSNYRGMGSGMTPPGLGFVLQDRGGGSIEELESALNGLIVAANQSPDLVGIYSSFSASTPRIWLEVDREKAKALGVPLTEMKNPTS